MRLAQWLPWEGALAQRIHAGLTVRASYRFHWQSAPGFFTILPDPQATGFRTSDSDLGPLHAQTFGGAVLLDLPLARRVRDLHVDIGYERYVRSDNLKVDVTTCALGLRF